MKNTLLVIAVTACAVFALGASQQGGSMNTFVYSSANGDYTMATTFNSTHTWTGGGHLVSVIVSSPTAGASFEVYDSSSATTTTPSQLANIFCSSMGQYQFDVRPRWGISYRNKGGCIATLIYRNP